MPKHFRNGRSKHPEGQFTPLPYSMTQSEAWRSLSGNALKLLIELCTGFYGTNNGDLSVGLDRAARLLWIGKSSVSRAYAELEEKGFIRKVKSGSWIKGQATTWRVTFLPHRKEHKTNEWRQWKPDEDQMKQRRPWGDRKQKALDKFKRLYGSKTFLGTDAEPKGSI